MDPSTRNSASQRYVLMSVVAIDGQRTLMFLKASCLFKELKALLASTNKTATQFSSLNTIFMVCTAASIPACRLIALNKNPGVRPIGICEVVRRIISKAILSITSGDIQDAAGSLQLCAGQM